MKEFLRYLLEFKSRLMCQWSQIHFPAFLLEEKTRVHMLSVCSKSKKPEKASNLFILIIFLSSLDIYSTPQFELLIFQCLGLAGRFSVSISGVKRMVTPTRAPRRARGGLEEGAGRCCPYSGENEEGQMQLHNTALPAAFQ